MSGWVRGEDRHCGEMDVRHLFGLEVGRKNNVGVEGKEGPG